jgi:putative ABC transport system permease protein
MVSARTRMLARDLWHLRGQVFAAALVVACGIAALIGMYSTSYSLVEARRRYYDQYRLADVFVQLKRAPQSLAADIARIPGVVQVETRVVRGVTLDVPKLAEPAAARLLSIAGQPGNGLNRLRMMRGRYASVGAADEVIASETFARANNLGPGEYISAILNGRWQTLRIVGTALSPEYVYEVAPGGLFPDNRRFGVLWMNREALGSAFDMKGAFNDVALTLTRGATEADVIARLDRLLLPYGGLSAYGRSEQPSNRFLSDELAEIQVMATVIPALFLGVAGFLLYIVLARVVSMQRAEIALLKAFGYSDWSVGAHYLGFAAATAGLGVALGIPAGAYLGRGFVGIYRMYFHFPNLELLMPPELPVWVAILTLAAAGLGALAAVRRAVSLPPAEAMRPEPPARFRAGWLERIGLMRQVAPATRMVIRNVTRRPVKALLSVTTIAMAIGLMVTGRFALDAVNAMLELQFEHVQREDVAVTFAEPRSGAAVTSAAHIAGVTRVEGFRAVPTWLRAGYRSKRVEIVGVSPDQQLRRVVDQHSRPVRVPADGLILGEKLAEILGVRPGDALTVEALEGTRRTSEVRVVGLVDELLGLGAYMNARALARMLGEADAVSGVYLSADSAHAKQLFAQLKSTPVVASVSSRNALRMSIENSMTRTFNVFSIGLTAFAAVIVVGMVYNSMRVALSERGNELASLRVLGFTEGEIGLILLGEQILVTIVAVPVGLLIGYELCAMLIPAFSREAFRLPLALRNQTFVYAAGTALIAALSCGMLVARRLRNLDLIAVLKTRE